MKRMFLLLLLLILVVSFNGCFADTESTTSGQKDKKVVEILSIWPEDSDNGKLIVELTEQYIKEVNPNFDYEYELISVENLDQKIATLMASNDLPDIFVYDSGRPLKNLIEADMILNIGQALEDIEGYKYLDESAVELLKSLSGTEALYDLPLGLNIEGFWYNKELFEKAGVSPPETWNEFLEVCDTLLEAGIQPIAAGGKDKWPLTRYINAYAYRSMGYDVMDRAASGNIEYITPGLVEAATMINSMAIKGYFGDNVITVDQESAGEMMLRGQAAILYNGSWFTESLVSDSNPAGEDGIGFFSVPIVYENISGASEYPLNCGNILVLDAKKYDDQTGDWLYYFVSHIGDLAMEEFGAVKGYTYSNNQELNPYTKLVVETLNQVSTSTKWFEASMDNETKRVAQDNVHALVTNEMNGYDYMKAIQETYEANLSEP